MFLHCDIHKHVELRKDCKFAMLFMYLKRALASSSRALRWCGMSWGPSAAGASPTGDTLSIFWQVANIIVLLPEPNSIRPNFVMTNMKSSFGKSCSP